MLVGEGDKSAYVGDSKFLRWGGQALMMGDYPLLGALSGLPLLPDYRARLHNNLKQANNANSILIKILSKTPQGLEQAEDSFNYLETRGFVIHLEHLPDEKKLAIESKQQTFVPIFIGWKKNPTAPRDIFDGTLHGL